MSLVIWFPRPQQIRNNRGEAEKKHSGSWNDRWKLDIEDREKNDIVGTEPYNHMV